MRDATGVASGRIQTAIEERGQGCLSCAGWGNPSATWRFRVQRVSRTRLPCPPPAPGIDYWAYRTGSRRVTSKIQQRCSLAALFGGKQGLHQKLGKIVQRAACAKFTAAPKALPEAGIQPGLDLLSTLESQGMDRGRQKSLTENSVTACLRARPVDQGPAISPAKFVYVAQQWLLGIKHFVGGAVLTRMNDKAGEVVRFSGRSLLMNVSSTGENVVKTLHN